MPDTEHSPKTSQPWADRWEPLWRDLRQSHILARRENSPRPLLAGICRALGRDSAGLRGWVATVDRQAKPLLWHDFLGDGPVSRALGGDLSTGRSAPCAARAMASAETQTNLAAPHEHCAGCPMHGFCRAGAGVAAPLVTEGQALGVLCVAGPAEITGPGPWAGLWARLAEETALALSGLADRARAAHWRRNYFAVMDVVPQPMALVGADFRYRAVNRAYCDLFGRAEHDMVGSHVAEVVGEENFRDPIGPRLARCLSGETVVHSGWISASGRDVYRRMTYYPHINPDGNIAGAMVHGCDLTDQKAVEDALVSSEDKYRLLVEHAQEGIAVLQDHQIKLINPKGREVLGYAAAEIQSRPFAAFVHPEDRQTASQKHNQRIEGEDPRQRSVLRVINKTGDIRWIEVYGTKINWEGRPAVLTLGTDITHRRMAEEALRASEERFQLAIAGTRDGLWDWDIRSDSIFCSDQVATMLGYEPGETPATLSAWLELMHPDDREAVVLSGRSYLGGRAETYEITFRMLAKDGSYRWICGRGKCTFDDQGRPMRFVGFNRDVTEEKQAQQALADSERLFRKVFEALPIGLWIVDREGKHLRANPAAVRIWGGASPADWAEFGRFKMRRLPSGREVASNDWALAQTLKKGVTVVDETLEIDAADGVTRTIVNYSSPVYDEDGHFQAAIVVNHDISRQKQAEKDAARLETQLRQAQKMDALGTLAGGIAHDFNNILAAVMGYAELAGEEVPAESPLHHDLEQIRKAANRGKDLVRHILAFSHKAEARRNPLDLNRCLGEAVDLLQMTLPKMVAIDLRRAPEQLIVKGDFQQLEQVVINLVTNASHAMDNHGVIGVRSELVRVEKGTCLLCGNSFSGIFARIRISDSGSGIKPDHLHRIFDPFFTTKGVGEGTGLGLSTVYGVVTGHGGHLCCDSRPGLGTVFDVYFKAEDQESRAQAPRRPVEAAGAEGRGTVLLVDDEEAIRDIGGKALAKSGYTVLRAKDGEEALEVYRQQAAGIAAVILDLGMPGMGGRACLEQIRKINPQAKVLIASGCVPTEIASNLRGLGAGAVLHKPYGKSELLEALRALLAQA